MPLNTLRVLAFAHVQRQAQQLGRAFHGLAFDDLGNAQVDLGKVVDGDGGGNLFATGLHGLDHGRAAGGSNRASSCSTTTRCIRCWYAPMPWPAPSRRSASANCSGCTLQEGFHLRGHGGQHGLEVDGQQAEGFDAGGAHVLQARRPCLPAWPAPRACWRPHRLLTWSAQQHDFARGAGRVRGLRRPRRCRPWRAQRCQQRSGRLQRPAPSLPSKRLAMKPAARLAMFTYLPIRSEFTRSMKSSAVEVDVFVACR